MICPCVLPYSLGFVHYFAYFAHAEPCFACDLCKLVIFGLFVPHAVALRDLNAHAAERCFNGFCAAVERIAPSLALAHPKRARVFENTFEHRVALGDFANAV